MKRAYLEPKEIARLASVSAKYAEIAPSLVLAISEIETPKTAKTAEAVKRVRRKLHQMVGAYLDADTPFSAWLQQLQRVSAVDPRPLCREILLHHSSTRERLPEMSEFFRVAFDGQSQPATVADLACGLNPLARPFMPLPRETLYRAYDVHLGLLNFVGAALQQLGYPIQAVPQDLLSKPTTFSADVILLLKTIPCLEQAEKEAGRRVLRSLDASLVVVSYPTASLGGTRRGMERFYEESFVRSVPRDFYDIETHRFKSELMFRLHRRRQHWEHPKSGQLSAEAAPSSAGLDEQ